MRALVVGLGRMGTFHARVLRGLGLDVVTVDPDSEKGADMVALPSKGPRFDVVCVAVPIPDLAYTAQRVAVAHEPDYMLVEKPFASTLEQAERLRFVLSLVPVVGVGFVERFNPVIERLIVEQQGRRFQQAVFTRLNDRPTPNAALDLWSHDLDLVRYLRAQGVDFDRVHFEVDGDRATRERSVRLFAAEDGTRPHGAGLPDAAVSVSDHPSSTAAYDLTAHDGNPLEAMWTDLLGQHGRCATPRDAVRVLQTIGHATPVNRAA